jgi:FtsP/CotA-like multicopper oxidase with cupredoxin domain
MGRTGDRATNENPGRTLSRRQALIAGIGAVGGLSVGSYAVADLLSGPAAARPRADVVLRPTATTVQLGSRRAATWTFNDKLPGPEVRLTQGRPVRIRVDNDLLQPTSVHWHGIRLKNDADGVPGFTQDPIAPGGSHLYEFTPPDAGTYFFHSHVGTQLDRGLYGALIVDARREELSYDEEAVLVLDDWLDGVAGSPDQQLKALQGSGMTMQMGSGSTSGAFDARGAHTGLLGEAASVGSLAGLANQMAAKRVDVGDVTYPLFLINGRPPADPHQVPTRKGQRTRLRIINAAADTTFCFFVEGQTMTVTHSDGQQVDHVKTDALVIGMGERYDVLVDTTDGSTPRRILAVPLGKPGRAVAILRPVGTAPRAPDPAASYSTPRRIVDYRDLRDATAMGPLPDDPQITNVDLSMGQPYRWTMGGDVFADAPAIALKRGRAQRFVMRNRTMMPHPMHLHGHSFRTGPGAALKDTIIVPPMRTLSVNWVADNPGAWAFHCHNVYHQEAGMMRKILVA